MLEKGYVKTLNSALCDSENEIFRLRRRINEGSEEMRQEGEKYRPCNGDEGIWFQNRYCCHCIKDKASRDGRYEDGCRILADTMAYNVDDKEYPAQWTFDKDGSPICTAFEKEAKP